MPKRPESEGAPISLFPFLSILACVIGTLILMITGLALSQMGSRPDEDLVRRAEEYAALKRKLLDAEKTIKDLETSVAEAAALQERLTALQRESDELQSLHLRRTTTFLKRSDLLKELSAREERLKKLLAELLEDHKKLLEQIKPLEVELAKRKDIPTEAVVRVAPGGSGMGAGMRPVFVETDGQGIAIHTGAEPKRVSRGDVKSHPEFLRTLDVVAKNPRSIVIFLIRDNGISNYQLASSVASSRKARHGKLPVAGHGKLDFSLFEGK